MANKTKIEWTDFNWNFLRGCSRVSEGCRNCYAEGIAARFSGYDDKGKELPYFGLAQMVNGKPRWTGEISFHEDVLLQPLRWTKPRKIFVNSTSDLFHEKVTDDILDRAFAVMALTPQHTYQILTKRPERMKKYFDSRAKEKIEIWPRVIWQLMCGLCSPFCWPDFKDDPDSRWPLKNVWIGVSVEDQKTADERIPLLLDTPAAVRWISAEPLLGPVDLAAHLTKFVSSGIEYGHGFNRTDVGHTKRLLDWIVVGGESGSNARPMHPDWARSIRDQCQAAGVRFFFKQGSKANWPDFKNFDAFPAEFQIREFPNGTK